MGVDRTTGRGTVSVASRTIDDKNIQCVVGVVWRLGAAVQSFFFIIPVRERIESYNVIDIINF